MTTQPSDLASRAKARRAAIANAPDRQVFRTTGSSHHTDSRLAQLQRHAERQQRVMDAANAVAPYLGSDPKRRAVVVAANWRAHKAYLRLVSAREAIDQLTHTGR